MKYVLSIAFFVGANAFMANAQEVNWDQWRGPNKNGSVESAKPPFEWSLEKNIAWKADVPGKGSSTPIVHGIQVIVLTAIKTDRVKEGLRTKVAIKPTRMLRPRRLRMENTSTSILDREESIA